jgi:Bacterial Ig-like domain (group 3)
MKLNQRRFGASAMRLLSVTAAAAAACALWGGTASAATASVAKHATKTTISISPKTAYTAQWVRLSARVSSSGGGRARGTVTFQWHSEKVCSGRLVAGAAHCRILVAGIGRYPIRAYYGGNATHRPSVSSRAFLTVRRAPTVTKITNAAGGTVTSGKAFTFHVSVSAPVGVVRPIGTVVVTPAGLPFATYGCDANVVNGKGSCTIHPPAYGVVSYSATFQGNPLWKGSTYAGPYDLAVQNVTQTTIAATSTTAGDVTLTASVTAMDANITGANKGTGSVTIYIGTTAANVQPVTGCAGQRLTGFTGAPDFDNTYTCTGNGELNGLAAGTYYISAVYSGDAVDLPSDSNPPTPITIG